MGGSLASAGGVYCSACVETTIEENVVRRSSRWGVALRAQAADAVSRDNVVARNRLSHLGLQTTDFGGISLIAYGARAAPANTTIAHNCVRDVRGVWSGADGALRSAYAGCVRRRAIGVLLSPPPSSVLSPRSRRWRLAHTLGVSSPLLDSERERPPPRRINGRG